MSSDATNHQDHDPSCARARERLPWYLNGTLEAGERQALEEHLESCDGCRRELDETRFAARAFTAHVPAAVLADLAFGALDPAVDRALVEAHAGSCAACGEELALARASAAHLASEPATAVEAGAAGAQAEAGRVIEFRDLRESVARRRAVSPVWRTAALAASVTAVVAAGGWWSRELDLARTQRTIAAGPEGSAATGVEREEPAAPEALRTAPEDVRQEVTLDRLEQEAERLRGVTGGLEAELAAGQQQIARLAEQLDAERRPRLNPPVVTLQPADAVVRGAATSNEVAVAPGDDWVTLALASPEGASGDDLARYADFAFALVDAGGKVVLEGAGLRPQPQFHDFTLQLHLSTVPEGGFTIRLFGVEGGGQRTELAAYPVGLRRIEAGG